ncbi:MAG: hypothetical protein IJE46_00720 [Clostridia bacterium]|nr:hypothetical protein [Clostridia bacterium]
MNIFNTKSVEKLFEAILLLKSKEDCVKFFEDVCTVKELQDMSQRLDVAYQLKEGKSYQDISKNTGASTTTISRVNRCLMYGNGGYKDILERLKEAKTDAN